MIEAIKYFSSYAYQDNLRTQDCNEQDVFWLKPYPAQCIFLIEMISFQEKTTASILEQTSNQKSLENMRQRLDSSLLKLI